MMVMASRWRVRLALITASSDALGACRTLSQRGGANQSILRFLPATDTAAAVSRARSACVALLSLAVLLPWSRRQVRMYDAEGVSLYTP